jgi:hypothetical protein
MTSRWSTGTLQDQIGGQLDAGFLLAGFYEDRDSAHPLAKLLPTFAATRAVRHALTPPCSSVP